MPRLYIDIETIPTTRDDVLERLRRQASADAMVAPVPGSIRKLKTPELRKTREQEWRGSLKEGAADTAEEAIHRTALDGGYGELACICWAFDDGEIHDAVRGRDGGEVMLLHKFFADLRGTMHAIKWVGHNVEFDLRFLHHRSIINGVRSPQHIPANDAPWKGTYYDTMREWSGLRGTVKLTVLCDMLGIDISEDDIDGSEVWQAWQQGRIVDIVDHCRADVERVREIYRRMTWR